MWRFTLIGIFSFCLALSVRAQSLVWATPTGGGNVDIFVMAVGAGANSWTVYYGASPWSVTWNPGTSSASAPGQVFKVRSLYNPTIAATPALISGRVTYGGVVYTQDPRYSWKYDLRATFSPEYAGKSFEIKGLQGSNWLPLGSPFVVGSNGGALVITGSVYDSNITEIGYFMDGVRVDGGTNRGLGSATNTTVYTNFSELNALSAVLENNSNELTRWRVVDEANGKVMKEGAGEGNPTQVMGSLPLATNQRAKLQAYVQPVKAVVRDGVVTYENDGAGYWADTGLSASGAASRDLSGYYRAAPVAISYPNLELNPVDVDRPFVSVATNIATNVSVNYSPGVTRSTNTNAPTNDMVPADFGVAEYDDADDGEVSGLAKAQGLLAKLKAGVEDWGDGFGNIGAILQGAQNIGPSGVGSNCTFQLGQFAIHLGDYVFVREGAKYLVFLWAAFAMVAQVRRMLE